MTDPGSRAVPRLLDSDRRLADHRRVGAAGKEQREKERSHDGGKSTLRTSAQPRVPAGPRPLGLHTAVTTAPLDRPELTQ